MQLSNEERRFIYNWLHNLLGRELSAKQLTLLQEGSFEPFFTFMQEIGFAREIVKLRTELTTCVLQPYPDLELAADFAQLFLLEGSLSALPYASAYLNEIEQAVHFAEINRLLTRFQLQPSKIYNEPSDHICIHLEILDKLISQNHKGLQQKFLAEQLLNWLPQFVDKAQKATVQSQFYPTLLQLLLNFVIADLKLCRC